MYTIDYYSFSLTKKIITHLKSFFRQKNNNSLQSKIPAEAVKAFTPINNVVIQGIRFNKQLRTNLINEIKPAL